jgi:hypothetical protein
MNTWRPRTASVYDAGVSAAIAGDNETEATSSIYKAGGQVFVLCGQVLRQVLNGVVTEVAVQFADDGVFIVVQRDSRRARTLDMEGCEVLAADFRERFFDHRVKICAEGDPAPSCGDQAAEGSLPDVKGYVVFCEPLADIGRLLFAWCGTRPIWEQGIKSAGTGNF